MTNLLAFVRCLGENADGAMPALEILLRVTATLAVAMVVALALRRSSAALRHMVWTLSLVGTLLIPLCYWAFPAWHWAILPQRQESPVPAIAPLPKTVPSPTPLRAEYASQAKGDKAIETATTPPPAMSVTGIMEPSAVPVRSETPWSWTVSIATLWALGTILGFVWLGIGVVGACRVVRRAQPLADPCWRWILEESLARYGFRRPVEIRECLDVSVPMTWDVWRPVILVPAGGVAWSEATKRSVLLHELGHIRRSDCLTHLLGRLACVVYWFHPVIWLAARQARKASEQAADDLVLTSDIAPPDYAEHLVGIASQIRGLRLFGHVALPMANPSDLEGRVLAILDPQQNHRSLKRKSCYALMAVAMLFLIPCAVLRLAYAADNVSQEQGSAKAAEEPSPQQKIYLKRREVAERLVKALNEKRFGDATGNFTPALTQTLPTSKLETIWQQVVVTYGPFEMSGFQDSRRFGAAWLLCVPCQGKNGELELRIAFDREQRIDGLWIEAEKRHASTGFRNGGYRFGAVIEAAAKADLSLEAIVLGLDGRPVGKCGISFWMAVDGSADQETECWHDPTTGKIWRGAEGAATSERMTAERLSPGVYRVHVTSGHSASTPIGLSEPIVLDGSRKHTVVEVRMKAGPTLTFQAVDAVTGKPAPRPNVVVTSKSANLPPGERFCPVESGSRLKIENLPPGTYSINANLWARRPDELEYRLDHAPLDVEMVAGKDREVTLAMRATPLTEKEIAERWPNVVAGRVTNDQGQPIEGATLRAHGGMGTLLQTGITESGKDGRYLLRYADSGFGKYGITVVFASKPGFAEKSRSGSGEFRGGDRTHSLDFVLIPAPTLDVQLLDAEGKPIAGKDLCLTASHLPPASSVLGQGTTDSQGQVRFRDVPPSLACWFTAETSPRHEVRTPSMNFSNPEKYRVELRLKRDVASQVEVLEVVGVINNQGKEVRDQVIVGTPPKGERSPSSR